MGIEASLFTGRCPVLLTTGLSALNLTDMGFAPKSRGEVTLLTVISCLFVITKARLFSPGQCRKAEEPGITLLFLPPFSINGKIYTKDNWVKYLTGLILKNGRYEE
jgi:hypothetical protein